MTEREQFEAFVLQETGINLRANVEAMTPGIGLAWRAWQAATQRQQERIAEIEAQVEYMQSEVARTERNRDMWRNQCQHQADALTTMRPDAARYQFATAYNDQAIEALRRGFCKLPRFSFMKDAQGSVRKVPDQTGNFVEFTSAHELFDPVMVDSLLAKMLSDAAIDAAMAQGEKP